MSKTITTKNGTFTVDEDNYEDLKNKCLYLNTTGTYPHPVIITRTGKKSKTIVLGKYIILKYLNYIGIDSIDEKLKDINWNEYSIGYIDNDYTNNIIKNLYLKPRSVIKENIYLKDFIDKDFEKTAENTNLEGITLENGEKNETFEEFMDKAINEAEEINKDTEDTQEYKLLDILSKQIQKRRDKNRNKFNKIINIGSVKSPIYINKGVLKEIQSLVDIYKIYYGQYDIPVISYDNRPPKPLRAFIVECCVHDVDNILDDDEVEYKVELIDGEENNLILSNMNVKVRKISMEQREKKTKLIEEVEEAVKKNKLDSEFQSYMSKFLKPSCVKEKEFQIEVSHSLNGHVFYDHILKHYRGMFISNFMTEDEATMKSYIEHISLYFTKGKEVYCEKCEIKNTIDNITKLIK